MTLKSTKSGINVAEDSGGLDVDGMDVGHGLHIDTVLQQQLFDLLSLCKNGHCKRTLVLPVEKILIIHFPRQLTLYNHIRLGDGGKTPVERVNLSGGEETLNSDRA